MSVREYELFPYDPQSITEDYSKRNINSGKPRTKKEKCLYTVNPPTVETKRLNLPLRRDFFRSDGKHYGKESSAPKAR